MIFECGSGSVDFTCKCERVHYNMRIDEEIVICSCGIAVRFERDNSGEVFPGIVFPESVQKWRANEINNDPRNLC